MSLRPDRVASVATAVKSQKYPFRLHSQGLSHAPVITALLRMQPVQLQQRTHSAKLLPCLSPEREPAQPPM